MLEELFKKYGVWGLVVGAIILVAWWYFQYIFERADAPGTIIGTIENPPGNINVSLDNGKYATLAHRNMGWFRFDDIEPGEHMVDYEYDGYHPRYQRVIVNGGKQNYFVFPKLTKISSVPSPQSVNTLKPVLLTDISKKGEEPKLDETQMAAMATALVHAPQTKDGWIYLGTFQKGHWSDKTVSVSGGLPKAGDTLNLEKNVFLRENKPKYRFPFTYKLAKETGVVKDGAEIRIESIEELGQDRVWAKIAVERN